MALTITALGHPARHALAALLLASACASATRETGARAPSTSPTAAAPRTMLAWVNTELRPIAQPLAVGGVAVGVVSADSRKLLLVGVDPATGHELWRQPLTPSMVSTGTIFHLQKLGDDRVAYFRPTRADGCHAELVVADARTGRDIVKTPEAVFTSWATLCRNGKDLCTTSRPVVYGSVSSYRMDVATGRYLEVTAGIPHSADALIKDLLDLDDGPDRTLALLRDGKVAWRVRESSAFPLGPSGRKGFGWYLFADQHVLVGSVRGHGTPVGPKRFIWDLPTISASVGISEATGEVLWRDPGSDFKCRLGYMEYPVRCRSRGTVIYDHGVPTSLEGLDVTVEGFDVTTGKTTWSVPLGAATVLFDASVYRSVAGESEVVLPSSRGPIVLDLATGAVEPAKPGATFWCMKGATYESEPPIRSRDGFSIHYFRFGGRHAAICDARGEPARQLPSWAATAAAGARVGDHAVLAMENGYIGIAAR